MTDTSSTHTQEPVLIIEPGRTEKNYWTDLWRYRELFVILASLGPGLWITALNVKYRDFRYIIPFVVQFGLYVSPVGFSSKVIPEQWRLLYSLNPSPPSSGGRMIQLNHRQPCKKEIV